MKYIKPYRIFESLITDDDYEEYLDALIDEFGDEETAKLDLDSYIITIEKLQKKGGFIYRLVFLDDISDLNDNYLGDHWNIDSNFDNFYNSLRDEYGIDKKPFLIIAKIPPNNIEIDDSFSYYTELPLEREINIKNQPIDYKIIPFATYTDYTHIIF